MDDDTRTLAELAREALWVQDGCNELAGITTTAHSGGPHDMK